MLNINRGQSSSKIDKANQFQNTAERENGTPT